MLIGETGQGKTSVVEALVLRSSVNPLRLRGKLISDRTDAVLRMVGLVGLRPEGSDIEMLLRLQNKQPVGIEHGIPEIIVDDADHLPNDVLRLLRELSSGAYGRSWSILIVGGEALVKRIQALNPKPALPSVILLPRWDQYDLEEACAELNPPTDLSARAPTLLQNYAMHPKQLLRAVADGALVSGVDTRPAQNAEPFSMRRITFTATIVVGIIIASLVAILIFVQIDRGETAASKDTIIPLTPNEQ